LLVIDLGEPSCIEQVQALHSVLRGKRVTLTERWNEAPSLAAHSDDDPFALRLPTLLVANKVDRIARATEELEVFRELTGLRYPALAVSALTGQGLGELAPWLFDQLGIVRVYTKAPGKPAERDRPFTVRRGQTVEDVARLVHKDVARTLRYARVWGKSGFDGQQVGRDHRLVDGDIVELHS
jgi:ribosome-interacting GTPase 1